MDPRVALRRVRPNVWALAACALSLAFALGHDADFASVEFPGSYWVAPEGERLLHGIAGQVSWSMPLYPVLEAIICNHVSDATELAVAGSVRLASLLLVFVLGWRLHSSHCGALALAAAAPLVTPFFGETAVFSFLVLLSANLVAWRAAAPSPARGALAAAAVGTSLLVRSTLFLYPAVFAAIDWAAAQRTSAKRKLALVAPWLVVPALFLAPWIMMNFRIHERFILFERSRADSNVVAGALGFIHTADGDLPMAVHPHIGQGALGWAALEVLAHPARYASAVFQRWAWVAGAHPLIFFLALVSTWRTRTRPDCEVSLFSWLFIGLYCLMAIEKRYFVPIWPVLVVMACRLLPKGPKALHAPAPQDRASSWAAPALLIPVLGAVALALGVVSAYDPPIELLISVRRAAAARPADAWLRLEGARAALDRGLIPEARAQLAATMSLGPRFDRVLLDFEILRVLAAEGKPLDARLRRDARPLWATEFLSMLRAGRFAEGVAALERARSESFQPEDDQIFRLLAPWPLKAHVAALSGLERFLGAEAERLWAETAAKALRLGDADAAVRALSRALDKPVSAEGAGRVAFLARQLPAVPGARLLARLAAAAPPGAVAAEPSRAGDRSWSRAALQRDARPGSTPEARRRAALGFKELGDFRSARALLDELLAKSPRDPSLLTDRAVVRALVGEYRAATADLEVALRSDPGSLPTVVTLGWLYTMAGRLEDADRIYEDALRRPAMPDNERLRAVISAERRRLRSDRNRGL